MATSAFAQAPSMANDAPVLLCALQTVTSCEKDKACKSEDNFEGAKLPLNITVDIPSSVLAFAEADGWVSIGKITSAAVSNDLVMAYGIDGAVSWQLQVYQKTSEGGKLTMGVQIGTADAAAIGFGECEIEE
jgi:hypothetical protein